MVLGKPEGKKASSTVANPLEQFSITPIVPVQLGGLDVSFTNSGLFMVLAVVTITAFIFYGMRSKDMVPGRVQSMAELSYEFIAGMVRENIGSEGRVYFPFVFSLFMFILFGNLLGLIPGAFTFTSHIIVTFAMAAFVFVMVTIIALMKHGLHFFSFFVPGGVPTALLPLMVVIEVLSYLSRPLSLSIRLFANMMAGHTMMKVFASFIVPLGLIGGWAPLSVAVALTGFEFLVAFLQAYVFAVLTCMYLNDAVHLH